MAKRATRHDDAEIQKRQAQLEKLNQVVIALEGRRRIYTGTTKKQLELLESVSQGLYEEMDKLSKKSPAESVTDLALKQINDVISETKELAQNDTYIQRLNEFVPAGDNPQNRDVVVVLRSVRQGLERFRKSLEQADGLALDKLVEARNVREALRLYLQGDVILNSNNFAEWRSNTRWFTNIDNYSATLNFERLDSIAIEEYFSEDSEL